MALPVDTPARSQSGPLPDQWPTQATEAIVSAVGKVRDRTTAPAIVAARALVIRIANNYIPGGIWIIYLALGAIFTIGGLVLWSKAFATPPGET